MDGCNMKEMLDLLRAKDQRSENYLLKEHIRETLERLRQFHEFVNANRDFIQYEKFNKKFFKNLTIALFLHDLGKIDLKFQKLLYKNDRDKNKKLNKLKEFLGDLEKDENYSNFKVRHEILSTLWSILFLDDGVFEKEIRTAILLHHYNEYYINKKNIVEIARDYEDEVKNYLNFMSNNKENIKIVLENLIDYLSKEFNNVEFIKKTLEELKNKINFDNLENLKKGIKEHDWDLSQYGEFYEINNEKPDYDFFVFLGTLRRCDYSASGEVKIEQENNISEVFKNLEENIKDLIKEKIKKKSPDKKILKIQLWQKDIPKKEENLILVAPTGSGKTEFALLWAKEHNRKLIYTLPLRVALNDLYGRFKKTEYGYFKDDDVDILHSTSFIEYLKEVRQGETDINIEKKITSSKLFSNPVLLTTPDQIFLTSLKYYAFDKLVSIYPICSIVIDEIQTYNPEMAAIIIKTIEIIKELYGNILIITATFPPYFEKYLNEKKGFKTIDLKKESNELKKKIKNYNLKRHKIETMEKNLFEYSSKKEGGLELKIKSDSFKKIENIIKENTDKKIMVVVNNVKKAIDIHKELEKNCNSLEIDKENLYLLHSRLIEKEKRNRIERLKEKLENNKRIILVATQIIEASVDVDFDILITEISTIDSQVQRWGRIYRNKEPEQHYDEEKPANIIIFTGNVEDGKLKIDKGTTAIYDRQVIEKTKEVLKETETKEKILDYNIERIMIEDTFNKKVEENKFLKEKFIDEIDKNLEYLKYFTAEKKSEAQKLFRSIAGVQVVIPQLMAFSDDEQIKKFAEIVKNPNEKNISWKNIFKEKEITFSKDKLKRILYEYSLSIPVYYFEKNHSNIISHEFKGFSVLRNIGKIEELRKYGIDAVRENIESEEIKESEDNQI